MVESEIRRHLLQKTQDVIGRFALHYGVAIADCEVLDR